MGDERSFDVQAGARGSALDSSPEGFSFRATRVFAREIQRIGFLVLRSRRSGVISGRDGSGRRGFDRGDVLVDLQSWRQASGHQ
jgi:hypothetical protein